MKKKFSIFNFHFSFGQVYWWRKETGQSLIEIILVMGLSAIIFPALLTGLISSREGKAQQAQRTQAVYLLNETIDTVRSVRERGWAGFAVNGTFHPVESGPIWTLSAGEDTVNGFTRRIIISDVNRDPQAIGPIVTIGGVLDPSSKKVEVTISWETPRTSSVTNTLYMTRYLDNDGIVQTTVADFSSGTLVNTAIPNPPITDGEVILGAGGGGGDWCNPSKSIAEVDLPKSGVANAIMAIEGTVFAGTGDNASGVSFAKVPLVGDPPTSATVAATFDGYKTNTVFGEANYAYLGTDNNFKEVVIMDLTQFSDPPTNSKYKEIGSINVPGNSNGDGIYVLSNKAYVLAGTKLYIFDITTRSGAHSTELNTGGLSLSGTGKKVLVAVSSDGETYAYIATSSTSNQFQIVKVTNASSPVVVGQITLGTSQSGVDVYVNTQNLTLDRAYFATSYSSGKSDFFIVNISTKTNPTIVGNGYNTNGMSPKGITVVTGNKAVIVGTGGTNQYQVITISNETNPTSCASLQYSTGVYGVASVLQSNGYAYSYIITGDSAAELKIILGGAGGGSSYASAGTFTSSIIDAGHTVSFNRFDPVFLQPSQTTIGFQVAVAEAVGESCTDAIYKFIGPGFTDAPTDVFATGSAIPLLNSGSYRNPGRCFKYKTYFTSTDSTQTPELDSFTINYSP